MKRLISIFLIIAISISSMACGGNTQGGMVSNTELQDADNAYVEEVMVGEIPSDEY